MKIQAGNSIPKIKMFNKIPKAYEPKIEPKDKLINLNDFSGCDDFKDSKDFKNVHWLGVVQMMTQDAKRTNKKVG